MEFYTQYFLIFILFCIIGYICEVVYCSIGQRKLTNRGFMYGPWLPIYGFGGLCVELLISPLKKYPPLVFIFSILDTSIIEYIGSFLLEKIFSVKLWDYSKHKLNLNGRVCLLNSTMFGLMGLALVYLLDPLIEKLLNIIPINIKEVIAFLLTIVFIIDLTLSCVKMTSFKKAIRRIKHKVEESEEKIKAYSSLLKDNKIEEFKAKIYDEVEEAKNKYANTYKHILTSFPTATSKKNEHTRLTLENARSRLEALKKKKKGKQND